MGCKEKYSLRQCLNFWRSSLGSIKIVERVQQLPRPSHPPYFRPQSGTHQWKLYSPNTAKQVTMCSDLSCNRVFRCFSTPPFVLLGASAKFRCLGKLSHPSSLSSRVKTLIFISKITITTTSPILHFAPMRTLNTPYFSKKEQSDCHLAYHNHLYPSRWFLLTTNCCLGPRCT